MSYATLLFPTYETAVAAAQALGFWDSETDQLLTQGQTIREDGTAFSWMIDEIGLDPVVVPGTYDEEDNELTAPLRLQGYAVNACGELPEAVSAYAIPYGSAGRVFSGTGSEPHTLEPLTGNYLQAVAMPIDDPEP
jgi:hypothetical protein